MCLLKFLEIKYELVICVVFKNCLIVFIDKIYVHKACDGIKSL